MGIAASLKSISETFRSLFFNLAEVAVDGLIHSIKFKFNGSRLGVLGFWGFGVLASRIHPEIPQPKLPVFINIVVPVKKL